MIARTDSGLHLEASRGFYLKPGAPGLARRVRGLGHRGARVWRGFGAGLGGLGACCRVSGLRVKGAPSAGLKGRGFARMLRVH